MKKVTFVIAFLTFWFGQAQILEPVKWTTSVEKLSDSEFTLISKATIESGWHLYSQNVPEDGPIATTFTYDDSQGNFKISGNTLEEEGHTVDD
ncbi:MAG: hypothetical protein K9I95_09665, partial [Flavobacteriaceae bacterium]|nr:hypothetical protein [Flavobacteriaceae bacterium]